MQSEQRPSRILERVDLLQKIRGKLPASDQLLERLMHVESRGDELSCPHRASVRQRNSGRLAALDQDPVDIDLRLVSPAGRYERLHETARQVERPALAELIAALQIECADHGAHRAGAGNGVDEPGAEQRNFEQEEQLDVLVLEQPLHDVEGLPPGDGQKIPADRTFGQERFPLRLRPRLGIALRQEYAPGDLLGTTVPFPEVSASRLENRATFANVSSRSRPNTSAVPSRCGCPSSYRGVM